MFSITPISSVPISNGVAAPSNSAALALAPASPTIAINESEIESGSLALAPANPVFSLTAVWFSASITLTQQNDSINLNNYNGIAPWQAAVVDNSRRRQEDFPLQELRKVAPSLKQIRQSMPMLGD